MSNQDKTGQVNVPKRRHRGLRRFWLYFLPLGVAFGLAALARVLLPSQFHPSMETVSLFTVDLFFIIILMMPLSLGWQLRAPT